MPAGLAEPDVLNVEDLEQVRTGGPGGGGGPRDWEPGGRGGGDDDDFTRRMPRGGPSAGMFGIIAMMVSITALFTTIIIAFLIRSHSRSHWQPVALPKGLWASTALILASSATLEAARRAFVRFRSHAYGNWLVLTFFIALGFILSQALVFRYMVEQGIYLRQNPHSSLFYVITGAHGVHVFGGLLALFYLICRVALRAKDAEADLLSQRNALSVTVVYWHFLDVLWVALFLILLNWR